MKEIKAKKFDSKFDHGEDMTGVLDLSNSRRITQSAFISPALSGIKAILFDCDGVLCPPMRFADLLEREHQITREMTAEFFRNAFLPALLGKADVLNLLPPYLKKWNWKDSPERFLDIWLSSEREVRPDVVTTINELREVGYFVGVATNQESRRAKYLRDAMGFEKLFDQCFISSDIGHMKPQPEYFEVITNHLDFAPQRIIFIDDQQNYLDAAAACGWRTILFNDAQEARGKLESLLQTAGHQENLIDPK